MAKNKVKVPKKVGGIKVPKLLRKSGMVDTFLNSPLGRSILADVIVAAAGAAAGALARHRPSGQQVADAGEMALETGGKAASTATHAVEAAAGTLGAAFTEAARYIFPSQPKGKKAKRRTLVGSEVKRKKAKRRDQDAHRHWEGV
jgi:hypothetical protein